ncbi:hypothetical protein [Kitasatospora sp. NPDC090308]|uniref:hypothetical protein n=1 Tax=Kitasatospora sp. NPDC090308 TaxID=3364082 RepID=UPI0038172CE6
MREEADVQWTALPDPRRLRLDGVAVLRSWVERLAAGDPVWAVFRGADLSVGAVWAVSEIPAVLDELR